MYEISFSLVLSHDRCCRPFSSPLIPSNNTSTEAINVFIAFSSVFAFLPLIFLLFFVLCVCNLGFEYVLDNLMEFVVLPIQKSITHNHPT